MAALPGMVSSSSAILKLALASRVSTSQLTDCPSSDLNHAVTSMKLLMKTFGRESRRSAAEAGVECGDYSLDGEAPEQREDGACLRTYCGREIPGCPRRG